METSQRELDDERRVRIEQLSSQSEDYQKQIEQLQENLSKKENEYNLLNRRLNELEGELQQTIDHHTSKSKKYEEDLQSLTHERNALIDQQLIYSEEQ